MSANTDDCSLEIPVNTVAHTSIDSCISPNHGTDSRSGSFAPCSVCKCEIFLRKDGLIRIHGPVHARCMGSDRHPAPSSLDSCGRYSTSPASPTRRSQQYTDPQMMVTRPVPVKVIKKIPRGSRERAARKFADALENVISSNTLESWERLLHLPSRCFYVPKRSRRRWNLTSLILTAKLQRNATLLSIAGWGH